MSTEEPIKYHNPESGGVYGSWDELVEAEAHGYTIIALCTRKGTVPFSSGFWPPTPEGKAEATKARNRLRRRWVKAENEEHGPNAGKITCYVRQVWKEVSL